MVTVTYNFVRGCGVRAGGDLYTVTHVSKWLETSVPFDQFLPCPPIPINPTEIGLSAQGVLIREGAPYGRPGKWDMWDMIGRSGYPYFADWATEAISIGTSRKIPLTAPISLLNEDSLHILVYPTGYVENFKELYEQRESVRTCPADIEEHDNNEGDKYCTALDWEIVGEQTQPFRNITRSFPPGIDPPMFTYEAATMPSGFKPVFLAAVKAVLPIEWEIINDQIEGTHEKACRLMEELGKPYSLVEF